MDYDTIESLRLLSTNVEWCGVTSSLCMGVFVDYILQNRSFAELSYDNIPLYDPNERQNVVIVNNKLELVPCTSEHIDDIFNLADKYLMININVALVPKNSYYTDKYGILDHSFLLCKINDDKCIMLDSYRDERAAEIRDITKEILHSLLLQPNPNMWCKSFNTTLSTKPTLFKLLKDKSKCFSIYICYWYNK